MAEENLVTKEVDESLRRLKSLCDDGIISQSDFEEKKNQLLRLSAQPTKREAPPADTLPPKKKATPPPATPEAATPGRAAASIDLTNDTEAAPQPPPPAVPPPIAPPVAPPAAMPPPIAALLTAARAIAQPPRGITANPAALARFPAHDRRVLEARDLHDAVDATFGQDSDDDNEEPPPPFRGSFTDWEDAKYLELLIRYGQPKNENPPAMQKFLEEFGYRARASVTAHVNAFNVGAYKTWRAANGGQWAPFAWVKN